MSPELAAGVVREELGAPPEEIFERWDQVPVAAASIGQVHRAMTSDGRAVAVKVQYPGVEQAIRSDLDNLDLSTLVMPFLWRSLDARAMAEEIRARLDEELDYRVEAANQTRFAGWYRHHPFILVPEVVHELSAHRVLTTDLAEGVRFEEMERWDQHQRDLAAETIFRFVFRSLYRFHAFNGDPHPGNYLFQPDGRVSFLDFGLVKYFAPTDIGQLEALVQAAVIDPDERKLRQAAEAAGYYVPGAPISDARIAEHASRFYEPVRHDAVTTITSEYASELVRQLLFAHDRFPEVMRWGRVEPRFVVLQRINVGLVAILGRLEATANWRRIAEELWPFTQGPPSTELGRQEAEWWSDAGAAAAG
jgi:predicted unusual protein kinase regulating ubiquinone biosynthesis (AarF/ABC1/UbiB family)